MKYLLSSVKLLLINNFSKLLSARMDSFLVIKFKVSILYKTIDALFFVFSGEDSIFSLVGDLRAAAKIADSYIDNSLGVFAK